VLLEFGGQPPRLYRGARDFVVTREPGEVRGCLGRLRASGRHAAGFIGYEAGHALERKLSPLCRSAEEGAPPLLWFGLFDGFEEVDLHAILPDPAGACTARPKPRIAPSAYRDAAAIIREHIFEGDIYQANFTFQADVLTAGHPLAIYAGLRKRARAGWGAVVFTGEHWILSCSPELFFTLEGRHIVTRPMKGTLPSSADPEALRSDPKQRAENLMIVDLLRNDLSRVSKPGTVHVPELFAVETYPTVHQMTSTVTAELEDGIGPWDVIETIFPCGSVTGAPKIRAMEIIAEREEAPRGVYTGSIGRVAPDGEAAFNVAIRTLTLAAGARVAAMGLGSGLVADSVAGDEWRECGAKGEFVASARSFDLLETMRFDPEEGLIALERHLGRIKASADALGFAFDRHHTRNELQAASFTLREPRKLRLRLSPTGTLAIETRALPPEPEGPVRVAIAALPVDAQDFRLRHKTSDRGFYDRARQASGAFEVLFTDGRGFLTEGSFTSLFVDNGKTLLTPPLSRGLLPGIFREMLIEEGRAVESDLTEDDLRDGFYIGNAVRGLIAARLS
jgi:para-aminobenzoate synthetase/4-amino-4-deoxychorismate lyase